MDANSKYSVLLNMNSEKNDKSNEDKDNNKSIEDKEIKSDSNTNTNTDKGICSDSFSAPTLNPFNPKPTAIGISEPYSDPQECQNYFRKTTSRSAVIEIQNLSDGIFKLQDHLIIHGNSKFINPLPEYIQPMSTFTLAHGSNGFMTGVEGWAKYLSKNGILMKVYWMVEYIGSTSITLEINSLKLEKEMFKESTKNNVMERFTINNASGNNYLFSMLY